MKPLGESEPKGRVLYDGSCGFCSRWAPLWESTLKKRGFHIAPLQAAVAFRGLDSDLNRARRMADPHRGRVVRLNFAVHRNGVFGQGVRSAICKQNCV